MKTSEELIISITSEQISSCHIEKELQDCLDEEQRKVCNFLVKRERIEMSADVLMVICSGINALGIIISKLFDMPFAGTISLKIGDFELSGPRRAFENKKTFNKLVEAIHLLLEITGRNELRFDHRKEEEKDEG